MILMIIIVMLNKICIAQLFFSGRFNLLKEHFQTQSPACKRDELQQAVIEDDFEKVTAIIRKAYKVRLKFVMNS